MLFKQSVTNTGASAAKRSGANDCGFMPEREGTLLRETTLEVLDEQNGVAAFVVEQFVHQIPGE